MEEWEWVEKYFKLIESWRITDKKQTSLSQNILKEKWMQEADNESFHIDSVVHFEDKVLLRFGGHF